MKPYSFIILLFLGNSHVAAGVNSGVCVGEIDSFQERCEVLTNEEDCLAEGISIFSDGICDWIPPAGNVIPIDPRLSALKLGSLSFDVSTHNPDAADWFQYGLLQLLSFGYDFAGPAFDNALANDPQFALANAFRALNEFWPLWGKDDLAAANAILDSVSPNAIASPQEQLWIEAIKAHFNQAKETPVERFVDSINILQQLADEYPEDATAQSYLGVWHLVLSSLFDDDDTEVIQKFQLGSVSDVKAAAISALEAALAIDPTHPGALHFSIHAYDSLDVEVAKKGLPAADLYATECPGASHGVHMPVHIYFRLALYSKAYAADTEALQAADLTCALYGMASDPDCDLWNLYHSLEYLQYTGYQIGRWQDATNHFLRMESNFTKAKEMNTPYKDNLEMTTMRMRARDILMPFFITMSMDGIECGTMPNKLATGFWQSHSESGALLAYAMCLVFTNAEPDNVATAKTRMEEIVTEFPLGTDPTNDYNALINRMHVEMLKGVELLTQGKLEEAWTMMASAAATEDSAVRTDGSPTITFASAHGLYGIALLMDGTNPGQNAHEQFQAAIRANGEDLYSLLGSARAAKTQGEDSFEYYENALALIDPMSDTTALPFWSELEQGVGVNSGVCVGEIDSFQERCEVLTNEEDCLAEGISIFSDGICDWIPPAESPCDGFCASDSMCVDGMCVGDCSEQVDACCGVGGSSCGGSNSIYPSCVCAFDSYCCETQWDAQCVDEAKEACNLMC